MHTVRAGIASDVVPIVHDNQRPLSGSPSDRAPNQPHQDVISQIRFSDLQEIHAGGYRVVDERLERQHLIESRAGVRGETSPRRHRAHARRREPRHASSVDVGWEAAAEAARRARRMNATYRSAAPVTIVMAPVVTTIIHAPRLTMNQRTAGTVSAK
jgi:hypothetical protein